MKILCKNKRAFFDYEVLETLDTGIVLRGCEVKTLKCDKANISDAFVKLDERELRLINCDIPLYKKTDPNIIPGYEAKGRRKLLVTSQQLGRLRERTQKTGYRIIPLEIFADKRGLIKVKIALAKTKKNIDKKVQIKEKDDKKLLRQEIY